MNKPFIHSLADVQTDCIGEGAIVWQFSIVSSGSRIGRNVNISPHCFIESDVVIGDRVTIKHGVCIRGGMRISDDVLIGPNVSFTKGEFLSDQDLTIPDLPTFINNGVSIGAGAVVLQGLEIGSKAVVGAGSVVTASIPPNAIVAGNPAVIIGYVEAGLGGSNPNTLVVHENETLVEPTQVPNVKIYKMPCYSDIRGSLTATEFENSAPFIPRRYFLVYDVPSKESRGQHAHINCHQFLVCISGSCSVVADDGVRRQEFVLDSPNIGLYLPPMIWGTQYKYSNNAVLLVLASELYQSEDYIRDYEQFLNMKTLGK